MVCEQPLNVKINVKVRGENRRENKCINKHDFLPCYLRHGRHEGRWTRRLRAKIFKSASNII